MLPKCKNSFMKIVFFGSDDFAVASLIRIINSRHEVVACVTQPDRARDRGMKVKYSLLKETAVQHEIPVLQPHHIDDELFLASLESYEADVFAVVAYGKLLHEDILNMPNKCCVNVHGSLLPKYRGAAPINWAIIHGDKETGVTVQKMSLRMDAGEIISQDVIPIEPFDTSEHLRALMAKRGAELLVEALDSIENGDCELTPQNETEVTFAPKLDKRMGLIQWEQSAGHIERLVRGLKPWPGTFTFFTGLRLKILDAEICDRDVRGHTPGEVIEITKRGFVVVTGSGALLVTRVHLESSNPVDASVFISSYKLPKGFCLG